jgi:gliding motility-associated protein GldC
MRTSDILIRVTLDNENIPEKITWEATDAPADVVQTTKAFSLSVWDSDQNGIMKVDLWTKDMMVGEMKKFFIQTLGSMGETLLSATGDEKMFAEVNETCERLAKILMEEERQSK